MIFYVLGKRVKVTYMGKPAGGHGSVFEFKGAESLKKIGLEETFYFQMPNKFSLEYPSAGENFKMQDADTDYLHVVSAFLGKCIWNRKLVNQFSTPWI